jgi:hypothetical protein
VTRGRPRSRARDRVRRERVALDRFCLAALATWRVTHLLAEEDGPSDAVVRLRLALGKSRAGALMDCFYCLSVWIAAPLSLRIAPRARDWPLTWLAVSGAACLLERATGASSTTGHEEQDDVLWTEAERGALAIPSTAPAVH